MQKMGAEVISQTLNLSLDEAVLSQKLANKTIIDDDDENDISSSADVSAKSIEGESSINEEGCGESHRSSDGDIGGCDDHCTIIQDVEGKQRKYRTSIRSVIFASGELLREMNIWTAVLIPAALATAYQFFGTVYPSSSMDQPGSLITLIPSLIPALASSISHGYTVALDLYPLLTKALTTGMIQFFGDLVAQRYEQQHQKEITTIRNGKVYDLRRGLSLFADGLLLSGPLLHYCFEWMEDIWPTSKEVDDIGSAWPTFNCLCHVFVNDYVIDSIYIGLSFFFTGVVEGYSFSEVLGMFYKDYWPTVRASWLTSLGLIPIEVLCFGYLSLSFRVLAMNFVDLLWGAIVSFYSHRSRRENSMQDVE